MDAELLSKFVLIALNNINSMYYGQQIQEWMFERHGIYKGHPKRKPLEKYLSRYGERVFCYELYHQIRTLIDNYERDHPMREGEPRICFQGELQKDQISGVIEYFDGVYSGLKKEYIPDFLLHSIGNFLRQELIIEVKSDPKISVKAITEDLSKIQEFIAHYKYRRGIFLTVNASYKLISTRIKKLKKENWFEHNLPNREQIFFLCRERLDTSTYMCNLADLTFQVIE